MPTDPKARAVSARQRMPASERRESIVTAARFAFVARGYDGVRTQDLAAAADVSEALLYQHFASKRDLYCEVLDRISQALRSELTEAAASSKTPLETGLATFVAFVSDRSRGWSLLSSSVGDPDINVYQREARGACVSALADLLALDPDAGRSRPRLEQLAEVVAGGAEALSNWSVENPKSRSLDAAALLADFTRQGMKSLATQQPRGGAKGR